jgi:hypothetical protein
VRMTPPKGFAVSTALAGAVAVVATLPMFGVRWAGTALIIFALPGLIAITPLFGNVHTHVAILTLLTTWIIYLVIFLLAAKIVRVIRAQ